MNMTLRRLISMIIVLVALANPLTASAQDAGGIVDDSLRDMSIVLGTGTAGAILGLSTLSFVDKPSEHLKNIAVGGAIGIVIGVGVVVFSQATKSSISSLTPHLSSEQYAMYSKKEFAKEKIAENFFKNPSFVYRFSF